MRSNRQRSATVVLLVAGLLLQTGCGWWRRSAPDAPPIEAPAGEAQAAEPAPATTTPAVAQPNSAAVAGSVPMLDMQRDAEGVFVVSLTAESGLPQLKPGASRSEFDQQVARLRSELVHDAGTRIEVAPGGDYSDRELPLRVIYEFDADGRFVRTVGEF